MSHRGLRLEFPEEVADLCHSPLQDRDSGPSWSLTVGPFGPTPYDPREVGGRDGGFWFGRPRPSQSPWLDGPRPVGVSK